MLRTKGGDENSYKSSDAVNNIDWSVLNDDTAQYQTMLYYKGLIEMRKAYSVFTDADVTVTHSQIGSDGAVAVTLTGADGESALLLINPTTAQQTYTLDGEWQLVANGTEAGATPLSTESGEITLGGISVHILVRTAEQS
jgi:pullulanase